MQGVRTRLLKGSVSTELVLKVCIGLVVGAIVASCAVAVSLFRAQLVQEDVEPTVQPHTAEETAPELPTSEMEADAERAAAFEYMRSMHIPGHAEPTPEELEWMRAANVQDETDFSEEEIRSLLESM